MLSVLFASLLFVSDTYIKVPDIYLGTGVNIGKNRTAAGDSYWRKYLNLGATWRVIDKDQPDRSVPQLTFLSDFTYNPNYIGVGLGIGFEFQQPMGYRDRMALVYGLQFGPYYGYLTADKTYDDTHGTMNKSTIALLANGYAGVKFDVYEGWALRLLINPKLVLGRIAAHTMRSEFSQYVGIPIGLLFQIEIPF